MRGVAWILAVGACNGALGLDPVGLEPDDVDNDGIAFDNCRLVKNPDQLDTDNDGLGDECDPCDAGDTQLFEDADRDDVDDGCDPCANGPQHDEDDDGFFDGCDNCPIDASNVQLDSDGDGVGDDCDSAIAGINEQVFFDGFGPPDPRWHSIADMVWPAMNDAFVAPPPSGNLDRILRSPEIPVLEGQHWYLDLAFDLAPLVAIEFELRFDLSGSGDTSVCSIRCDAGAPTCTLDLKATNPGSSNFARPTSLRLRAGHAKSRGGSDADTLSCEIVDVPFTTVSSPGADNHLGFTLVAFRGPLRFTHAYAIR